MNRTNKFSNNLHDMLDAGNYDDAKKICLSTLDSLDKAGVVYPYDLALIACFLVDIGSENNDLEAAQKGLLILENYKDVIGVIITDQSYHYNYANAKSTLFRLKHFNDSYPTLETIHNELIEVKNLYYKAYKLIDFDNFTDLDLKIITNLSNILSKFSRNVEAISLCKKVLDQDPNFVEALIIYSEALEMWLRTSHPPKTIALLSKVYSMLDQILVKMDSRSYYREVIEYRIGIYKSLLESENYDFSKLDEDLRETDYEFNLHSENRKFSITQDITLSEHAIYCGCLESKKDNLSIGHKAINIEGDKFLKMELLLNRIKSEYSFARKMYTESIFSPDVIDDVFYLDLKGNEENGESVEKLRTSFRLCFGILDKIAHGICYYLDIKKNINENIYFESFWNHPTNKHKWNILKDMNNPHLISLYSIASDLNSKNGEFGFYKKWRNLLEHNTLILKSNLTDEDPLQIFNDDAFTTIVSHEYFKQQTLHILQICRSAIFSFVYFIRTENFVSYK